MCEANVYMADESGEEKLYFESVDIITPEENGLFMKNIYGQQKNVHAKIKSMSLVNHRVIIQKLSDND